MAEILFSLQRIIKLPVSMPENTGDKYQVVHSAKESTDTSYLLLRLRVIFE